MAYCRLFSWFAKRRGRSVALFVCLCFLLYFFVVRRHFLYENLIVEEINKDKNVATEVRNFINMAKTELHFQQVVTTLNPKNKVLKGTDSNVVEDEHVSLADSKPCSCVHTFYYPWYGNPKFDKKYYHWNHKYLPHWRKNTEHLYPTGAHIPPNDIGSNFYPELGDYSSSDPSIIEKHMQQICSAGIGVLSVSYYPPGLADDNGHDWQHLFPILLNSAAKYNLKVAFHIEPYKERTALSVKKDLQHIISTYGKYEALYKYTFNNKTLPLIYIYDSYHIKPVDWQTILKEEGTESIRGKWFDAIMIGLVVEKDHLRDMLFAGFNGFYTYFATDGFTFGSTRRNWNFLATFASNHKLIYIASIGPGYIDTRIRPWNGENTRNRVNGKYYEESWKQVLLVKAPIVSITSFNEWHEGTQIEKAVSKRYDSFQYLDYSPNQPNYYLLLTKKFVNKFKQC